MILIVDPIATLAVDFATLPEPIARTEFLKAIRFARPLLHTPEYTWHAYREGRLLPLEADTVRRALAERFGTDPEFSRLACLGFAYWNGVDRPGEAPTLRTKPLTVADDDQEADALRTFWDIAQWAAQRNCAYVSYGGRRWGLPYLIRRSILRGLTPRTTLPVGRPRLDAHFDVEDVLANWDHSRARPLELAALRYGLEGPWQDASSPDLPTDEAIRQAVAEHALDRATRLCVTRLHAIWGLYQRLAEPYLAAGA